MIENMIDNIDYEDIDVSPDKTSGPISFCWQNISVWKKQKETQGLWRRTTYRDFLLVDRVSGFVPHGSLSAIMGPSGSGKTTLLTAINGRLREGVRGDLYVNGVTVNADQMLTLSGFVQQDDLTTHQGLTVYEHFRIMSALKMDRNTSQSNRDRKSSALMREIGIGNLTSSYISDLSGGEKRRISIAVELLTDPLLLFCDEPTSGLDSANAAVVVKLLKKFSLAGKIVICSVHQPSTMIYELFNQVLLLASGGRIVYYGPPSLASDYFQKLGFICPTNYNIAEFLVNNVSPSNFNADERVRGLCKHYSESKMKHQLHERIKVTCSYPPRGNSEFISAFIATLLGPITVCSENSAQNIRGLLSSLMICTFHSFAAYQFSAVELEKYLVMREINNGLYRIEAYFIGKFLGKSRTNLITQLLVSVSISIILVLIFQFISNASLHTSSWYLVLTFVLVSTSATAYGCMLTAIFDNLKVMLVVTFGYEQLAYSLSGLVTNLSSLPIVLRYLRYGSLFYYYIEYILVLEWKTTLNSNILCEDKVTNGSINVPWEALQSLSRIGFDIQHYQTDVWILIIFTTIFFTVTYILLHNKSKQPIAY